MKLNYIVDKRYSDELRECLYHYIDKIDVLETSIGLEENTIFNIVDISEKQFNQLKMIFENNLYGNSHFKERLFQELSKFRLFNKIGEQKIFSVFICGKSGIGKTETARLLHNSLSPKEKMIKYW